ncbi:MAG: two component transcriptional regulator, LuxR family [Frankiales bacterium]|nr:two component transcriptional regulator, LuxR family [Frankiales bacterium]
MTVRVLVCDDHAMLAASLAVHLQERGTKAAVVTRPADAVSALKASVYDVCLLGLRLGPDPAMGMTAVSAVCEASPATAVVLLTSAMTEGVRTAALRSGAHCVADKSMSLVTLDKVVHDAGNARLQAPATGCTIPARSRVTKREREVLDLIARGLTSDETGTALGISTHTVRSHLQSARTKLAARNRLEAVAATTWSPSAEG